MRLNVYFNEMAPFGPFEAFIKGCVALMTGMAEMLVSSQEEMVNRQGMKMFAVERHGLPEDFVYFRVLCGVQSSPLVFAPNRPVVWGRYSGRYRERLCASGLRSPELSAQVRRPNSCISCTATHMDASITRTGRNG